MTTLAECRLDEIDYEFRPRSYWDDITDPLAAILRDVKGSQRRRIIRDYWNEGRLKDLDDALLQDELDENQRDRLGALHPSFMGGEYLPGYLASETEIARIELRSVTADVISVRAQPVADGRIHYRVVDEYETEFVLEPQESEGPLSLDELIRMLDHANSGDAGGLGLCFNEGNLVGGDAASLRHFTTVTSTVYPGLFEHYEAIYDRWVREQDHL